MQISPLLRFLDTTLACIAHGAMMIGKRSRGVHIYVLWKLGVYIQHKSGNHGTAVCVTRWVCVWGV